MYWSPNWLPYNGIAPWPHPKPHPQWEWWENKQQYVDGCAAIAWYIATGKQLR